MARRLQVFVSSTYLDLKEERQAAVEAILEATHIPAGMELFAAGNDSQLEVIKRWIDESDVYMLILGHRYGSIEPKSGKSYTHVEFDYAVETGKPVFSVVMTDAWRKAKQATLEDPNLLIEPENPKELKAFRQIVMGRMCKQANDRKDIKLAVLQTLAGFAHNKRLVGWVRGDSDDRRQELEKEVAGLKGELAAAQRQNTEIVGDLRSVKGISDEEWRELCATLRGIPIVLQHAVKLIRWNGVRPKDEDTNVLNAMIEYREHLSEGVSRKLNGAAYSFLRDVAQILFHHGLMETAPPTTATSHVILRLSQRGREFLIWHDLQMPNRLPVLPRGQS